MPYFPLYLDHLGYVGWQIGAIVGLQPMLRWTSALGWAHVADRWRVRRRLLVLAGLCGALAVLPFLAVRRCAAVAAVSMAIGLVHGPIIPMLDASVMDHLPGLGGDYGRLRLWGSLGFVVGALASAPLVGRFSSAVVPVLLLLAALPLAPALARLPREQAAPAGRSPALWTLLTPPLRAFLATAFLLQVSSGAWTGFYAVHTASLLLLSRLVPAESRTGGQALYGGIAYGLGGTTGLALAGALVDRIGTSRVFALEAVVALAALVPAVRLRRLVAA